MSAFRWEIEAFAGPAREAVIGGARLLVRVRMFNSSYESDLSSDPPTEPDAWTDLRPGAARDLAFELLAAAEHAEILTAQAGFWEHER
jgi:hypothetical protein